MAEILRVGTRLLRADTCHLVGLLMDNMLPSLADLVDVFKQKHVLSVCFKDIRVLINPFDFQKTKSLRLRDFGRCSEYPLLGRSEKSNIYEKLKSSQ